MKITLIFIHKWQLNKIFDSSPLRSYFFLLPFLFYIKLWLKQQNCNSEYGIVDCQDLYLNFFRSVTMLKKSLTKLNFRLLKLANYALFFNKSDDLQTFYHLLDTLHCSIIEHLRLESKVSGSRRTKDQSQGSIPRSVQLTGGDSQNEEQGCQLDYQLISPKSFNLKKLQKLGEKNKIKLAVSGSADKKFQQLMENLRVIILYQSKIEQMIQSINNLKYAQSQLVDENQSSLLNRSPENKQNLEKVTEIPAFHDFLRKVIQECKQIQEVQDNFNNANNKEAGKSLISQNLSSQKKSLLTEMLQENSFMQSQYTFSPSPHNKKQKPISQLNYHVGLNKRLLKEIDFSDYKIVNGHPRREKKVDRNNYGQCSKCTIF